MKVLVTGANGFLGSRVVTELLALGHSVRAMVRPASCLDHLAWAGDVETFRADLRGGTALEPAFSGIDCVVHLAAAVTGDEDTQFAASVVGTERLLVAMQRSACRRIVLASSFSVYDWSTPRRWLSEQTPMESSRLYERDGYAIAKVWQERIVRRAAETNGWELVVLRPGFIWGPGNEYVPGLGASIGRLRIVVGPLARLPLTYVENCARAFALAACAKQITAETINVVDSDGIRAWHFVDRFLKLSGQRCWRVPLPYAVGLMAAACAQRVSRAVFGAGGKLPSILVPIRYRARFRPLRYRCEHARRVLGWTPSYGFEEAMKRASDVTRKSESVQAVLRSDAGLVVQPAQ